MLAHPDRTLAVKTTTPAQSALRMKVPAAPMISPLLRAFLPASGRDPDGREHVDQLAHANEVRELNLNASEVVFPMIMAITKATA